MGPMHEGFQLKVEQACQAAQEFTKLYYDTLDKKRHLHKRALDKLLSKLYLDSAEAIWNGNQFKGKDAVVKFLEDLPTCEHRIESLDCQPLSAAEVSNGQHSIIVKTFGTVKYPNSSNSDLKPFHQSFILTSQNNVWKVATDNLRFRADV